MEMEEKPSAANGETNPILAPSERKSKRKNSGADDHLTLDEPERFLPVYDPGQSPIKGANPRKRIDFILVYKNRQLEEIHGKNDRLRFERNQVNRDKFKRAMLKTGLQIQEVVCGQNMFVKIHVPFKALCRQAEAVKLQLPLRGAEIYEDAVPSLLTRLYNKYLLTDDEVDYVSAPFVMDKKHLFENVEDEDGFFRPALRAYLVYQILIHLDIREREFDDDNDESLAKQGLPYLLLKGSYDDAFSLHDESAKDPIVEDIVKQQRKAGIMTEQMADKVRARSFKNDARKSLHVAWTRWFKAQPLWKIRNYFGEQIAFYFGWSGQLIMTLWVPSLLGFCIFLYGLYLSFTSDKTPTSAGASTTTPSPLSNTISSVEDILESIKESFDNNVTPYFSLIICLWGSFFLESWKRKRSVLAYEWDVDGFEASEPDRPEFYGTRTRPDPVTNIDTWYYPIGRQMAKFCASCSVLVIMVLIVLISGTGVVIYRVIITVDYCSKIAAWQCLLLSTVVSSVLNAVSILILGKLYEWIAYKLTEWENHRTRSDHDNALIIKLFAFQFANSYASLFYIAFFRGNLRNISGGIVGLGTKYVDQCSGANKDNCMSMLSFQVLVLMILKPFPKFLKDVIVPWVKSLWRDGWIFSCCRRNKIRASIIAKDITDCNDYIERERIKPRLGDFTLGEYTEKVIQYGYLMLFAVSLPLAPLIALVTNLADLRVDARRLIWVYRRPVAYMACDIGMWYGILEFVNLCGVISNAFLIAFTAEFGRSLETTEAKLWAVIIFEHLVFGLKFLISYTIPDVPSGVSLSMRRERYQVAKIFSEDSDYKSKSRRRESRARRRTESKSDDAQNQDA